MDTAPEELRNYALLIRGKELMAEEREKYNDLMSESSRVVYLPWSVVSLYVGSPYSGEMPTVPVLYSPKALEKAKDRHHNPREAQE